MHSLKITSWNVNGLYNQSQGYCKLQDDLFVNSIKSYDIIGLVETHCSEEDRIEFENYRCYQNNRAKHVNAKKSSGGLAVLIRNTIQPGVEIVHTDRYAIWLKLEKSFFCSHSDTYLAIMYIPPENSTNSIRSNDDPFQILECNIARYKQLGEIIIMGDFNARTATYRDFIVNDGPDLIDTMYQIDEELPQRSNYDKVANRYGNLLLELCVSSGLRILNGRMVGDTLGKFTCHKYNGSSTVDYTLATENVIQDIIYFCVHVMI